MSPQTLAEATREDLSRAYEAAQGPFAVAVPGQPDFIVMRTSDLEPDEMPLSDAQIRTLESDYRASHDGELLDAREALAQIRARYGV